MGKPIRITKTAKEAPARPMAPMPSKSMPPMPMSSKGAPPKGKPAVMVMIGVAPKRGKK